MPRGFGLLIAMTVLAGGTARADFVPVSQNRRVYANAQATSFLNGTYVAGPPVTQEFVSPDFGPFSPTASVQATGNLGARGTSFVHQDSSIGPTMVQAIGSAESTAHLGSFTTPAQAMGTYEMTARVSVGAPTTVELLSMLTLTSSQPGPENGADGSLALIQHLSGGDQTLVLLQVSWAGAHSQSIDQVLVLDPGEYSLQVVAHADAVLHAAVPDTQIRSAVTASLTIVPGPASLLGILGVLAPGLRRQRRRL